MEDKNVGGFYRFDGSNPKNVEFESERYDAMLNRILNMSSSELRSLLDNLDYIPEFRVSWINYSSRYKSTYPKKYAKKKKAL